MSSLLPGFVHVSLFVQIRRSVNYVIIVQRNSNINWFS